MTMSVTYSPEYCDPSSDVNRLDTTSEEVNSFFNLPYPVQVEIVSYLSREDLKSFAATSTESSLLTKDQIVWKKKLWRHSKIINLCLEGKRPQPRIANFFVKDPLLVDMKKLYEVLIPNERYEVATEEVERENFLSKIQQQTPNVMSFSSVRLQDLLNFLNTFFHRPPPIFYDPFSRGTEAPSFILFGPPETRTARKLALSFIASKNSVFETVGLVKGRPGGIGGGVTVEYVKRLMNLLPVRRARPRLLVEDSAGEICFHPDVAEVMKQIDGMIYYLDAQCTCHEARPSSKNGTKLKDQINMALKNSWQAGSRKTSEGIDSIHNLDNDLYELRAMLKATVDIHPPILVILTYSEEKKSVQTSDESTDEEELEHVGEVKEVLHSPSDFLHKMHSVENPWMISRVEVNTLKGVHPGINWLYERTRILQGK